MRRVGIINIDLNVLLKVLFYFYAFSLPFELIFEIFFGLDTIFKPFRIIGIGILAIFGLKSIRKGLELYPSEKYDLLFYGLLFYGIIISLVRIISGPFNLDLFFNDIFLVGLNALIFFVFKNVSISTKEFYRILLCFVAGIMTNCAYIFYTFFFQRIVSRHSGFSDNPNYTALAIGAVITFLLLRSNYVKEFWQQVALFLGIIFSVYIFLITGSRTGLIILVIAVLVVFIFSSIYRKILVVLIAIGVSLFLIPKTMESLNLGGPLILIKRINNKLDQDEVDVRFVLWKGVFRMLEEEGYAGMGIGQYKEKFDSYFTSESHLYIVNIVERGYYLSTHNDYLAILTDYGLPGLLLYLVFLLFSFLKLLKIVVYPNEDDDLYLFLSQYKFILLCCLIIFGIASENLPNHLFWFLMMVSTKSSLYEQ